MNGILSLLAGTLIAGVDVAALVLLTRSLGRKQKPGRMALLAFILALKLTMLGAAVFWMAKASWFEKTGAIAGLIFPFAVLVMIVAIKGTGTKQKLDHDR